MVKENDEKQGHKVSFTLSTSIDTRMKWDVPPKNEKEKERRIKFENFIQLIADELNKALGPILLQAVEVEIRAKTDSNIIIPPNLNLADNNFEN